MLFTENSDYSKPNFDFSTKVEEVGKEIHEPDREQDKKETNPFTLDKKFTILYVLSIVWIALFFSIRAIPSSKYIKTDQPDDEKVEQVNTKEKKKGKGRKSIKKDEKVKLIMSNNLNSDNKEENPLTPQNLNTGRKEENTVSTRADLLNLTKLA